MTSIGANNQVRIFRNSSRVRSICPEFSVICDFQAASQKRNDNSDGWDNADWGEPTQDPPKMVATKKQDSWGEFEDWLSDEKKPTNAKKD